MEWLDSMEHKWTHRMEHSTNSAVTDWMDRVGDTDKSFHLSLVELDLSQGAFVNPSAPGKKGKIKSNDWFSMYRTMTFCT